MVAKGTYSPLALLYLDIFTAHLGMYINVMKNVKVALPRVIPVSKGVNVVSGAAVRKEGNYLKAWHFQFSHVPIHLLLLITTSQNLNAKAHAIHLLKETKYNSGVFFVTDSFIF
jgi:hypothetical protein